MLSRARRDMVAVTEPEDVHGLCLVVHIETHTQRGKVSLHGSDAQPQLP